MSEKTTVSQQLFGIAIVFGTAFLWGGTGIAGEYLINHRGLDAAWITTYRTLIGGAVLVLLLILREKGKAFRIWRSWRDARDIVLFGLFGVGMTLYLYMLTVEQTNAPTATALQYLAPAMVVGYTALRKRKLPDRVESFAVLLALAGVFAIATHGNLRAMVITPLGLLIGILSAAALAFYGAFPKRLLEKYGSMYTIAWGQLTAGLLMHVLRCPIWRFTPPVNGQMDLPLLLVLGYQLLLGTIVSYWVYLIGVTLIGPARASIISSVEPAATALMAVPLLHTRLLPMDYVGTGLITLCVILLAIPRKGMGESS